MMSTIKNLWARLPSRDRMALAWGSGALLLLVAWQVGVRPAWVVLRDAPAHLVRAERDLQSMREYAAEALALQQSGPAGTLPRDQIVRQLDDIVTRTFGSSARYQVVGDLVTVTLDGVSASQLAQGFGLVRTQLHLKPQTSRLQRGPQGADAWSGTFTLAMEAVPTP